MTIDLETLVEWLGPEGAKAGLRESKLSLRELMDLAKGRHLLLSDKPSREEIANELVFAKYRKIDKKPEELLQMDVTALIKYFNEKKPSRREITDLLNVLGVQPGSEGRKSLFKFAAREISDIGMYQRVAHGNRS